MNKRLTAAAGVCIMVLAGGVGADWPAYNGDGGYVAPVGDHAYVDGPAEVRLLWKNQLHTGFGKGSEKIIRRLADEDISAFYGGVGSPVVADGVVVVSFIRPAGEVLNEHASNRYHKLPAESELGQHPKNLIDGDDVTVAMNAENGEIMWEAVEPGRGINMLSAKRGLFGQSPVITDGKVVVMGSTGRVYAYDLKTGERVWETTNGGWHDRAQQLKAEALEARRAVDLYGNKPLDRHFQYRQTDPVVVGDRVIVPDHQQGLLGLNLADGSAAWHIKGVCDHMATPAPVTLDGEVFVLTNDANKVSLIDPRAGAVLWTIEAGLTTQSLAPGDGYVMLNTRGTTKREATDEEKAGLWGCFKLSKQGAELAWGLPFEPAYYHAWKPDRGTDRVAVIHAGRAYFKGGDDKKNKQIYTYDLATGKQLDADLLTGNASAPTVVGPFIVYDADSSHSAGGKLHFYRITDAGLDPLGGIEPKAQGVTGYRTPVQFAASEGRIYVRGHRGIACYDLRKAAE